jgi:hypothetical protein
MKTPFTFGIDRFGWLCILLSGYLFHGIPHALGVYVAMGFYRNGKTGTGTTSDQKKAIPRRRVSMRLW